MKTLAALIVALWIAPPCTAQSAAPVTLRPVLQQLRSEFDTHRETLGATDALTTVKHGLRDWVESRLMTAPQNVDTRAFPLMIYDPRAGDTIKKLLSLQGNPAMKEDWWTSPKTGEVVDFIDFCRSEGRFAKRFVKLS